MPNCSMQVRTYARLRRRLPKRLYFYFSQPAYYFSIFCVYLKRGPLFKLRAGQIGALFLQELLVALKRSLKSLIT